MFCYLELGTMSLGVHLCQCITHYNFSQAGMTEWGRGGGGGL